MIVTVVDFMLAALVPVLSGARVTVRKAISTHGIGGGFGRGWLDRLLGQVRCLPRLMTFSLRNTFRRKSRLILTLFTLTLGGAIFIAVFNTQVALNGKMDQVAKYFGADVNLDFARSYRVHEVTQIARSVPGVERVEVWISTGADLVRDEVAILDVLFR